MNLLALLKVFFALAASGDNLASGGAKLAKVLVEDKQGTLDIKRKEDILLSSVISVNGKPQVCFLIS